MSLHGQQIFVAEASLDRVSSLIRRYVEQVGTAAGVDLDSDKPSPGMARRTQREFTLSVPRNGLICIWEDGCWGDKKLARYLSRELETRSIWMGLSFGQWAYVIYANGAVTDSHFEETEPVELAWAEEGTEAMQLLEPCYAPARDFARFHTLPFAFIYMPDPNMPAYHAAFKKAFEDLLALEPRLEGRVEVEYDANAGDELTPELMAETEAEAEALRRQRAEAESFPKLTIPCKRHK